MSHPTMENIRETVTQYYQLHYNGTWTDNRATVPLIKYLPIQKQTLEIHTAYNYIINTLPGHVTVISDP